MMNEQLKRADERAKAAEKKVMMMMVVVVWSDYRVNLQVQN